MTKKQTPLDKVRALFARGLVQAAQDAYNACDEMDDELACAIGIWDEFLAPGQRQEDVGPVELRARFRAARLSLSGGKEPATPWRHGLPRAGVATEGV